MKNIIVTVFAVGMLTACAGATIQNPFASPANGPASSADPTPAVPVAALVPAESKALLAALACHPASKFLDPDAMTAMLNNSPNVTRRSGGAGRTVYTMVAGYTLKGLPIAFIEVMGNTEADDDSAVLAYTMKPTSAVHKAFGISNQKPRVRLYTMLIRTKTEFSHGQVLTQFGCAKVGSDE
jgi:hypothetical protein